jgi:hypothetical protein
VSRMRRHRTLLIHPLILLALQSTASGVALAQGDSAEIPENAHANSFGSGWQCDYGYRAVDQACVAVKVPENGYLAADSAFGPGWQCDRGYRAVDEACVAVKVPENGYLANFALGPGWQCDRGYRAVDEACVAVKVPENAHIDLFGNGWECNAPYRKQQDGCTPPIGGNPWSSLQGVLWGH